MAFIQNSAISFTQGCVNFCQSEQKIKRGGKMIHKHETTHSLSVCVAFTYADIDSKHGDNKIYYFPC
jgi:hypothetical protein